MKNEIIVTKNLSKYYNVGQINEVRANDNINLKIKEGEFAAIIGSSGSGKSTLLHMLGCLDTPTSGQVILADEDNFYESKKNGLNIIVGGSLVSRGFTFNNLLVEIILNSPEQKIPADTLLQRARWFGYRRASNRYKYMKIIMSPHIYNSFAEFIALQKCMFEYIEDVNKNLKKLDSDTAIQAFSKYELIIPSNKK